MDTGDNEDRGFNLRGPKNKKKRKSKNQAAADDGDAKNSFTVDTTDPRIAAVFNHPDFAIDPTHTEFRSSDGMATFPILLCCPGGGAPWQQRLLWAVVGFGARSPKA